MTIRLNSDYSPDPGRSKATYEEQINVQTMQTFLHGKMITKFEITIDERNTWWARMLLGGGSLIDIVVASTDHCEISFTQKGQKTPDFGNQG